MQAPRLLINLLFISGLLLCQCEKKKDPKPEPQAPQLPPETMEGKGTFGCLVNGQVFLPDPPNFSHPLQWSHSYPDQFSISARKNYTIDGTNIIERVGIGLLSGVTGIGVYELNNSSKIGNYLITYPNYCNLVTNSINNGIVEITRWDMGNYIVSGRFSFTVTAPGCDTIRVTSGRFDISL